MKTSNKETHSFNNAIISIEPAQHALKQVVELEIPPTNTQAFPDACFENMPVEIEILANTDTITDQDGIGFKIGFSKLILDYQLYNCRMLRQPQYEYESPSDVFRQAMKNVTNLQKSSRIFGEVGITGLYTSIMGLLRMSGRAGAGSARSKSEDIAHEIEASFSKKLIEKVAGGRWEIGDPRLGDPRKIDGILKGRYFTELDHDLPENGSHPLCLLTPKQKRKYSMLLEVRADFDSIYYQQKGRNRNDPEWKQLQKQEIEKITILKQIREQNIVDGLSPPEHEIILARGKFNVSPKGASSE